MEQSESSLQNVSLDLSEISQGHFVAPFDKLAESI